MNNRRLVIDLTPDGQLAAALARAEAAEASREALADRLVFEMEQRDTLAARVAELEAKLEEATRLLSIAIDRLPEEEQEIVALRWALSGPFTNELPTIAAADPQEMTP